MPVKIVLVMASGPSLNSGWAPSGSTSKLKKGITNLTHPPNMVERRLAYAWSLLCTSYAFLNIVTDWRQVCIYLYKRRAYGTGSAFDHACDFWYQRRFVQALPTAGTSRNLRHL